MRVLFRVDAIDEIGSGHFMRCLNLADALNLTCTKICFISRNLPVHLQEILAVKSYDFLSMENADYHCFIDDLPHSNWLGVSQERDALDTLKLAKEGWDWLVIDHYGIDIRWERRLRPITKKILVIDDLADRDHDCDFLLDQNLYVNLELRYNNKVPSHCVLLLGPSFVLLRDEFIQLRNYAKARSGQIKRILVFFGSVDKDNNTTDAIKTLIDINYPNLQVDVVVGIQHHYLQQIKSLCEENHFTCHIQTQQIAELMLAADFAIGAGGISTYERLFLRLPALLKPLSSNQITPLKYMSELGLFDLFFNLDQLKMKLIRILKNENNSPPDCVEDGSNKLASLMADEFVSLYFPSSLDIRRTFHWLQNKNILNDFLMASSPIRPKHFLYWRNLICDLSQRVFSIYYFGKHVGNCGFKNINLDDHSAEIWLYLGELSVLRHGVADCVVKKLIAKAKNELDCSKIYLHVARDNIPAINLYKKNSFFGVNKLLQGPWAGRDDQIVYMEYQS